MQSSSPHVVLRTDAGVDNYVLYKYNALQIAKLCGLVNNDVHKRVKECIEKEQQGIFVKDVQLRTQSFRYRSKIRDCLDSSSQITGYNLTVRTDDNNNADISKISGKVRYRFEYSNTNSMALVTTDRQSGFDRMLALVPFKGRILNLISAFWFSQTKHIIPNHVLSVPHPNVCIVRKCTPFPIEFVVRAYMTGSTNTSIWKNYQNGVRLYCGHTLSDGFVKNQKLPYVMLTPTTKAEDHDEPISPQQIVQQKYMTQSDFDICASAALKIFAIGQRIASSHGLILVDTKYEFGKDCVTNEIRLIDEVHTPDSSRYWIASSYQQRIQNGKEPENIDKEFLRLWFRQQCDPYDTSVELPQAPKDLVLELSRRYISLYEMITGQEFEFDSSNEEMKRKGGNCRGCWRRRRMRKG